MTELPTMNDNASTPCVTGTKAEQELADKSADISLRIDLTEGDDTVGFAGPPIYRTCIPSLQGAYVASFQQEHMRALEKVALMNQHIQTQLEYKDPATDAAL
ncbi:hypothetical protein BGZ49_002292 [Haplosporangium sp. Z 27]|nr:hypothetical protein BGZ49_002292 [Haplosporangium sp. Z 27]